MCIELHKLLHWGSVINFFEILSKVNYFLSFYALDHNKHSEENMQEISNEHLRVIHE